VNPSDAGAATAHDWRAVDWDRHVRQRAGLSYVDLGEGHDAVLFIHGLGAQWRVWLANLPVVAAHRRTLAVDLPGFGDSALPQEPISIRGYAEALGRLCDDAGIDRVVAVGSSMGGFIAAELALARPDLVERLVLVGAAGIMPTRGERARALPFLWTSALLGTRIVTAARPIAARPRLRRAALARVVRDAGLLPADLTYHALLGAPGPATRAAITACFSYLSHDWGERLRELRCPTLVVWGERDALIPVRHAAEFGRRIANAQVVVLPGTGHLPMVEQPELFNATLLEFVGAGPGRTGKPMHRS
jgi:pimeloyl-ACP methyl ester carboxylesterase